ncbi:peroxiredoxin [Candidatus Berkelbacteria bacterium]|nr:peroxiredoxin [Candidatus Berkelbacteria bacterium]MBI4030033.1 peroxiredoxin [Candidatus Berkelbacteria bacterium]
MPEIEGETFEGRQIKLAGFRGKKNVVLYFYPKDNTPGCTIEALDFTQLLPEFEKLDTQIIGVSVDSLKSHQKFCQQHNLNLPLISDQDQKISRKLGLLKPTGLASRTTFVINKKGKIVKIYENVSAVGHAKKVLEYLQKNDIIS